MQLLRRRSVEALMQRRLRDLVEPFLPARGACTPGEDIRNPDRMAPDPSRFRRTENADRNVAGTLAECRVSEHKNTVASAHSQRGTPSRKSIAQITEAATYP